MRPFPKAGLHAFALALALAACPGLARAQSQWNILDTHTGIVPGSALDLSGLNDAPAGQYDAITVDNSGDLVFSTPSGRGAGKQRFYGPNIPAFMTKTQADALVARLSGMGYNVVRILGTDIMESWQTGIYQQPTTDNPTLAFNATSLDQLDYLLSALKNKGIYVQMDLFYLFKLDSMPKLSSYGQKNAAYLFPFVTDAYSLWQQSVDTYLGHFNTHTNTYPQDDPMIIGMSPWNENLLPNMGNPNTAYSAALLASYNAFLTSKSLPTVASFPITSTATNANTDGFWKNIPAIDLLTEFYMKRTTETFGNMKTHLKGLGVPGLVTGMNYMHSPMLNYWRSQGPDVYENHLYSQWDTLPVQTSSGAYMFNPSTSGMLSKSLSTADGTSWPAPAIGTYPFVAVNQEYAKPVFLTEFHDVFPNPGRDQAAIFTSTIGAFQGWDLIQRFAFEKATDGTADYKVGAFNEFSLSSDPLALMSEYEGVLAFRAGHLKQGPPRFAIVRDKSACNLGSARWTGTTMGNLAYLPYMYNVVTVYIDNPSTPMAVYKISASTPSANIASGTFPASSKVPITTATHCKDVAQACITALDSGDFSEAQIKSLQQAALNAGMLASETGEILFDYKNGVYTANTPYMLAVAGSLNGASAPFSFANAQASASNTIASGGLYSASLDGNGTLFASSLDGKPLSASTRILVVATTDAKATGATVSLADSSGNYSYTVPSPTAAPSSSAPNLLLSSTGQVTFSSSLPSAAYTAYKVGMTGARLGALPLAFSGNQVTLAFTTNNGFAFEIAADPVKAVVPSGSFPTSTVKVIVDNNNAYNTSGAASSSGIWQTSNFMPGFLNSDYHYSTGPNDTFRWTPTLPAPGVYQVYFHYPSGGIQASTRASCTISYSGGSQTVPVNEQGETGWTLLGTFPFNGAGYVEMKATDYNSGFHVDADAVAFVRPAVIVIDNNNAINTAGAVSFTPSGAWSTSTTQGNYYGADYAWALAGSGSGAGSTKIRWTPTIDTEGDYLVYYRIPDGAATRSPNVTYTINAATTQYTVTANQQLSQGGTWQLLGTYHFLHGTAGYVELSDAGAGAGLSIIGDAVAFVAKPF